MTLTAVQLDRMEHTVTYMIKTTRVTRNKMEHRYK